MSSIKIPSGFLGDAVSVGKFLELISTWRTTHNIAEESFLSGVWYRGHGEVYTVPLQPGVYRKEFTDRAKTYPNGADDEEKRLNLERKMLDEFRTTGAILLNANNVLDVYFIAQHHGMPTRLLDWTTNPLAGLFFAVENTRRQAAVGRASRQQIVLTEGAASPSWATERWDCTPSTLCL